MDTYLVGTRLRLITSAPIPGSFHETGEQFEWWPQRAPGLMNLTPIPASWLAMLPRAAIKTDQEMPPESGITANINNRFEWRAEDHHRDAA
jgi:hypothetical protein